jgi:hypothetical protein
MTGEAPHNRTISNAAVPPLPRRGRYSAAFDLWNGENVSAAVRTADKD